MSLFAKKQLLLGIEHDRISAAYLKITKPPQLEHAFYIENPSPESINESELINLLLKENRPDELKITTTNRIAKHYIIENIYSAKSIGEIKAIAAINLETLFNTDSNDWEIEIDLEPGNKTALACALPKSLLSGMRTFADQYSLKTTKISSFFSSEANRFRKKIDKQEFWLVVKERNNITLAYYDNGGWQTIRNNHIKHNTAQEIQEHVTRNSILHKNKNHNPNIYLAGLSDISDNTLQLAEILPREQNIWPNDFRIALSDYWP